MEMKDERSLRVQKIIIIKNTHTRNVKNSRNETKKAPKKTHKSFARGLLAIAKRPGANCEWR